MRNSRWRTTRFALGTVVLPLLMAAASVLVTFSFLNELPDPVATHWGAEGVDGFSGRASAPWIGGGLAAAFGVGMGLVFLAASRKAPQLLRAAGAMACGLTGFIATIGVASLWIQRGLEDARNASDSAGPVGVALLGGALGAALGAIVTPGQVPGAAHAEEPVPADAPRAELDPTAGDWTRWVVSVPLLLVVLGSGLLGTVVLILVGMRGATPWLLMGVPSLLALSMGAFRVRIGQDGLVVRSLVGVPRFTVPLCEIAQAEVSTVSPLRDYGGWGIRANGKGGFGVIMRSGEALQVRRGDGSRYVVTMDDARTAAGLLNTLVDAHRSTGAQGSGP